MKILVTGASGFIGRSLIHELLVENSVSEIYVVTRKCSNNFPERVIELECDLVNLNFDQYLPQNIDVIVHLAQSREYKNFPEQAMDIFNINVYSTQILLDWGRKNNVKHFVYASSGNVYGSSDEPLDERSKCSPTDFYGKSKYIAETLVTSYSSFFSTTVLRIFGVYGPGQSGMIIPNIIDKVLHHENIILANSQGLIFTPLFITDCVKMIKTIIFNGAESDIFNLSGNNKVTLAEIVSTISKITEIEAQISYTSNKPASFIGNCNKFIDKFSYLFMMPFNKGLELTIKDKIQSITKKK